MCSRTLSPLVKVLSMIPPLAVLPILFIALGVDELSKIVLIVFGIAPFMARDVQQRVEELPAELLIKAQTLGASTWQLMLRVVLPQVVPRLLDATAARARRGVAVPDRSRGDRGHRRPGLPDLSRAPLPRHGRHPAVRRVDHAARVRARSRAAARQPSRVSVVRRRSRAMSALQSAAAVEGVRPPGRAREHQLGRRVRRVRHDHRRVGLRQDHVLADPARRGAANARRAAARRQAAAGRAGAGPRRRVPEVLGVPAHDGAQERDGRRGVRGRAVDRTADRQGAPRDAAARARHACGGRAREYRRQVSVASSRAACNSGSRSRRR